MGEDLPEPMSPARFTGLVEAYGSRIDRWPDAYQEAGRAFAMSDEGRAVLSRAEKLDAMLDTYVITPPSTALQGRILAAANRHGTPQQRFLRWWEGLGLVGIGLAGVLVGVMAVSIELSGSADSNAFYDQATTVFGDIGRTSDLAQEAQ